MQEILLVIFIIFFFNFINHKTSSHFQVHKIRRALKFIYLKEKLTFLCLFLVLLHHGIISKSLKAKVLY